MRFRLGQTGQVVPLVTLKNEQKNEVEKAEKGLASIQMHYFIFEFQSNFNITKFAKNTFFHCFLCTHEIVMFVSTRLINQSVTNERSAYLQRMN